MEELKAWLRGAAKSVTMWWNSVCGVVAAVITDLPNVLPDIAHVVSPEIYKWLLFANIIGNMLLRVKTNTSLKYR